MESQTEAYIYNQSMYKLIVFALNTMTGRSRRKSDLSDEQVIEQIVQNQNSQMVGVLYDRYVSKVYRKCISFVKEDDIAENLTHDIFIKVYLNLASFKGKSKFSTWLYSITYNFCIDYLRKSKKMQTYSIEDQREAVSDMEVETLDDIKHIEAARLKVLLEKVKPDEKMILLLKYRDDKSIKDIQKIFNISESAVKMRIKRAKEKVRNLYKEHYKEAYV